MYFFSSTFSYFVIWVSAAILKYNYILWHLCIVKKFFITYIIIVIINFII